MKDKEKLINESFEISEHIRYIAVYDNDGLSMKQRRISIMLAPTSQINMKNS